MKKAISVFLVFAVIFQLYLPVVAFANANSALNLSAGTSIAEYTTTAGIDNYADTLVLSDQELDTVEGAFWWFIIYIVRNAAIGFIINQYIFPPRPAY